MSERTGPFGLHGWTNEVGIYLFAKRDEFGYDTNVCAYGVWVDEMLRLAARVEKLERVREAAEVYESEATNPAPDYALRRRRREELFAALAACREEKP